jgi:Domain of unknown function (DUF1996)
MKRKKAHSKGIFYKNRRMFVFVGAFALVGLAAVVISFAALSQGNITQPETGLLTGNISTGTDAGAPDAAYVAFGTCPAGQMGTPPDCMSHTTSGPLPLPAGTKFTSKSVIQKADGNPAQSDGSGNFRIGCNYSHMSNDDPIVYPGQPGKAHLHTFFGNTGTNASSTYTSLRTTGNATCDGGTANKSAYWIPTLINPSGIAQLPDLGFVYYKSTGYTRTTQIHHIPNGLKIIAGNASATSPQTAAPGQNDPSVNWYCNGAEQSSVLTNSTPTQIPASCPKGYLTLEVEFPQCWDGINLDSADHKSHMAYPYYEPNPSKNGCDAGHPVPIPAITIFGQWPVPGGSLTGWKLSSDMYSSGPGGMSAHADYMEAWEPSVRDTFVDNCDSKPVDCGGPNGVLLGNGTMLGYYTLFDGN